MKRLEKIQPPLNHHTNYLATRLCFHFLAATEFEPLTVLQLLRRLQKIQIPFPNSCLVLYTFTCTGLFIIYSVTGTWLICIGRLAVQYHIQCAVEQQVPAVQEEGSPGSGSGERR